MSDAQHKNTQKPQSSHDAGQVEHHNPSGHSTSSYGKFFAMIGTSTTMMLVLMYLNTYQWTHLFWSETRFYMAFVMGAAMALVMLTFMLGMYKSKAMSIAIYVGSIVVFALALWLVRSQATVGDNSFMRAMIPHHSIAIMTSSRSNLSDPRAQKLANEIVYAQDKEIAEMRFLINDIDADGDGTEEEAPEAQIVPLSEALSTANVTVLDPEFLTVADIAKVFPDGAACTFNYTIAAKPSVAMGDVDGEEVALMKLSGDLIRLSVTQTGDNGAVSLSADGLEVTISPTDDGDSDDGLTKSTLIYNLDAGSRAGFIGWTRCNA
ncbi:DUF305 domain-containing protein [Marivita sp.]|uniref:DUF305 domain-containing protein n=1 Tax=Marivita sp. TaxID=2003365 RepID=UPI003B523167